MTAQRTLRSLPGVLERSNQPAEEPHYDLLTLGRVGVDLYPARGGVTLDRVDTFRRFLGGTATNVAVAAARYGHQTAVVTKVGDDPFGVYVRRALEDFGVSADFVGTHPDLRTPVVFCELHPPDTFPLLFYREPTAPDMTITVDDLNLRAIARARIVWTTGTGLSEEPSRTSTMVALRAAGGITIHDLDHRPMFWSDLSIAREHQERALKEATVAIGNTEECAVAVGEGSPEEMARRLQDLGPEIVVVKRGTEGVSAFCRNERIDVPVVPVEVVNGLGAGDAFGGAFCHGLLEGWSLSETISFANAAGAYVAARLACADAMPEETDVRGLLRNREFHA